MGICVFAPNGFDSAMVKSLLCSHCWPSHYRLYGIQYRYTIPIYTSIRIRIMPYTKCWIQTNSLANRMQMRNKVANEWWAVLLRRVCWFLSGWEKEVSVRVWMCLCVLDVPNKINDLTSRKQMIHRVSWLCSSWWQRNRIGWFTHREHVGIFSIFRHVCSFLRMSPKWINVVRKSSNYWMIELLRYRFPNRVQHRV